MNSIVGVQCAHKDTIKGISRGMKQNQVNDGIRLYNYGLIGCHRICL